MTFLPKRYKEHYTDKLDSSESSQYIRKLLSLLYYKYIILFLVITNTLKYFNLKKLKIIIK